MCFRALFDLPFATAGDWSPVADPEAAVGEFLIGVVVVGVVEFFRHKVGEMKEGVVVFIWGEAADDGEFAATPVELLLDFEEDHDYQLRVSSVWGLCDVKRYAVRGEDLWLWCVWMFGGELVVVRGLVILSWY